MFEESKRLWVVVIWLLSIFIIIVGIDSLIVSIVLRSLSYAFIGLSDTIAGLVLFPPFHALLERQFRITMPGWIRTVLFFGLFAISNVIYLASKLGWV